MRDSPALGLAAAGCFAGVAALWVTVERVGPFPGDERAVAFALDGPLRGWKFEMVSFFGQIGTEPAAALTVLVACAAIWSALDLRAAAWVAAAASAAVFNYGLKQVLGPTPLAIDQSAPNFPSGHVVYATVLFGSLAVLALRRGQPQAAAICAFMIVAMGPARILQGSHVVSDVLAGYLFGAGWLLMLVAVWGRSWHDVGVSRASPHAT